MKDSKYKVYHMYDFVCFFYDNIEGIIHVFYSRAIMELDSTAN
uniref:Uncharacterized protein n=1 Tax=Physcomitrium patens TaxID=3218 RepID=A0A2K1KTB3_PHYPA|nr:hypothetical protein PHYPA_004001 [Physcomitrium patens]